MVKKKKRASNGGQPSPSLQSNVRLEASASLLANPSTPEHISASLGELLLCATLVSAPQQVTAEPRLWLPPDVLQAASLAAGELVAVCINSSRLRAATAGLKSTSGGQIALGGVSEQLRSLRELVTLPLKMPQLFERYHIRPPRGVLLYGPPGTGKTCLARAAAADAHVPLFVLNGPDVVSAYYGESEDGLLGVFAAARAAAPSIIFIDEIDALAPARESGGGGSGSGLGHVGAAADMGARIVTTLLTAMDGFLGDASTTVDRVVVIAATNRPEAVDVALRRPGRFDRELEVGVPTPQGRAEIVRAKLQNLRHDLSAQEVAALAAAAHGFVGADLTALARQSSTSDGGTELRVTLDDFRVAETRVRPSAMREVALEVPNVSWADVGGLDGVKQRLQEAVEWPQKNPAALARIGATPPRGVLLYGPPGCSKTLLARAVANEAKLNFLAVKGPELFSKYVGESEKAVAALFARARAAAPAIIFFDEIDGLAGSRGDGSAGGADVGERVMSQLLTAMDGLQARVGVVVIAATNRPDRVDAALLRPGRFDRLLYVPPPDAAARAAVFAVHTKRTPLAPDVDLQALAAATEGYTGADITAVIREAALAALQECLDATHVAARHFSQALNAVPSSAPPSAAALEIYQRFLRQGRL
ncbi:hypothetical protein WJX72_004612 [[Myrmecia] bisecta]|uniref:AAA+ ATPase domain-containing protein n=1 Tax=[Myrmecia] bisecta TaxID=41462 RepID=A0AAW1PHQ3_9CHLO